MKKYKLININTKEEHLCDKVTIDGFDYYVSDGQFSFKERVFNVEDNSIEMWMHPHTTTSKYFRKVIATNNPNIDVPKVVDEVFKLAYKHRRVYQDSFDGMNECIMNDAIHQQTGFYEGYNKSQEKHPYSASDIVEFNSWVRINFLYQDKDLYLTPTGCTVYTTQELLQIWEEQRPKIVYYE